MRSKLFNYKIFALHYTKYENGHLPIIPTDQPSHTGCGHGLTADALLSLRLGDHQSTHDHDQYNLVETSG